MLTALRKKDNQDVIGEYIAKDSNAKYLCPCCKEVVIHKKPSTRKRIGHFSHKAIENSECPNRISESHIHLRMKLMLYEYLVKNNKGGITKLEAWIANKRRPDILVKTKEDIYIAFEIQCSSIGLDEINARNEYYTKHDIHVCWLLPFERERFFTKSLAHTDYPIWYNDDEE